ncbi:hypothetical protein WJ972_15610 [Achromobacter insuavis]
MIWILIFFAFGETSISHEFYSQKACEDALQALTAKYDEEVGTWPLARNKRGGVCVKKGSTLD